MARRGPSAERGGFLARLRLDREDRSDHAQDESEWPFSIPAVHALDTLVFHPSVTFLTGENGSGKSTLIESIAIAAGYNPQAGYRVTDRADHDSCRPTA